MIVFILVHKNLRKTNNIIFNTIRRDEVSKIYLIISSKTPDNILSFKKYKKNFSKKLILYKHNQEGISGAWLKCMQIAAKKNSDFLIFENDIIPSSFFFKYARKCFSFYSKEKKFFGFTGYAPHNRTKIKDKNFLDTFLSFRSNSWSFGSSSINAKKYIKFLNQNSKEKIGKIIFKNKSRVGEDIYKHFLIDLKNPNKHLQAYKWNAFVLSNNGFFVHPSEHLVSYYGNDIFAENSNQNNKSLTSECDVIFSKDTNINFRKFNDDIFFQNKIVIKYSNPTILKRYFETIKYRIIRKIKNMLVVIFQN